MGDNCDTVTWPKAVREEERSLPSVDGKPASGPEEYVPSEFPEFDEEDEDEEDTKPAKPPKVPEWVERLGDGVSVVTLNRPFTFRGKAIAKVRVHEPIGAEIAKSGKGRNDQEILIHLIAAVAGIPVNAALDGLKMSDIERIVEEIDFLKKA